MPTQIIQYLQTRVQYNNSNPRYTASTRLDAVAHERVATYHGYHTTTTLDPERYPVEDQSRQRSAKTER